MEKYYRIEGDDYEIKDFGDSVRSILEEEMDFELLHKAHSLDGPRIFNFEKNGDELELNINDLSGNEAELTISSSCEKSHFYELLEEIFILFFFEKIDFLRSGIDSKQEGKRIIDKLTERLKKGMEAD